MLHPFDRMLLFRPAFWRTLQPGFSVVPLADRVTSLTRRSSKRIKSAVDASVVVALSIASLRRSASLARSRASLIRVVSRLAEPGVARASRCSIRRFRALVSPALRPGTSKARPSETWYAITTPPVDADDHPVSRPSTRFGLTAKATCQRPDRSHAPGTPSLQVEIVGSGEIESSQLWECVLGRNACLAALEASGRH
jgi:hypothetical protein